MKNVLIAVVLIAIFGGSYVAYQNKYRKVPKTKNQNSDVASTSQGITISFTEPKTGTKVVNNSSLLVQGKTAPYAEVSISDQDFKADALGNFSTTLTLDQGENVIVVTANDDSGNFAEETLSITLE